MQVSPRLVYGKLPSSEDSDVKTFRLIRLLRRALVDSGYSELSITSDHDIGTEQLPAHHKDPFDRLLVAQALVEGITLLTSDAQLTGYPGHKRKL